MPVPALRLVPWQFITGLLSAAWVLPGTVVAQPRIVVINPPPGHSDCRVVAVSDDGLAAAVDTTWGAFRWRDGDRWDDAGPNISCTYQSFGVRAAGLSVDGHVLFGHDTGFECMRAFRWTAAHGRQYIGPMPYPTTRVTAVSADGSIAVGEAFSLGAHPYAVRWTPTGGMQSLGWLPGYCCGSIAWSTSADGRVAVGESGWAWRWTEAQGMQPLDPLPGSVGCSAHAVSPDGAAIAGTCVISTGGPNNEVKLFKWTDATGVVEVPSHTAWTDVRIWGMSSGGEMTVGGYRIIAGNQAVPYAAIWTHQGGSDLRDYLQSRGTNVEGWHFNTASAINAAGDIIGGWGELNGEPRGFIAYLSACYPNCDGSTRDPVLNIDDFICFVNEFATASMLPHEQQLTHYANCDQSTEPPVLTIDDFLCFIEAFAQGCP